MNNYPAFSNNYPKFPPKTGKRSPVRAPIGYAQGAPPEMSLRRRDRGRVSREPSLRLGQMPLSRRYRVFPPPAWAMGRDPLGIGYRR
jgi:hypothetical protein